MPTASRRIKIAFDQRWAILGASGAGKTTLIKRLLWEYARGSEGALPLFIVDTKGYMASLRGKDDFREFYRKGTGALVRGQNYPKIQEAYRRAVKYREPFTVWQPEFDDMEVYDAFLEHIYRAGIPTLIDVDEVSSLQGEGSRPPRFFNILLKQGRGLDIAMVNGTQSPAYIPDQMLRQASHVVRFRLNDDYDRGKMAKVLGRQVADMEPEDEHGFFFRDCTKPLAKNPPIYYEDMSEFFGQG